MRWTLTLMQVRGIEIKLHLTFLLILALGGLEWGRVHGASGFAFGVLLMAALFTCVTLHELGHSLAAQYFKIPVREIVLLPIGGVAVLDEMPRRPVHELVIAAAGPVVNVALAAALALGGGLGGLLAALDSDALARGVVPAPSLATFVGWLLVANIALVIFNLIPAFPLDGGRMLRAGLALFTGYRNATAIAASIGQTAALLLGAVGVLTGNFVLALIAIFVFFGARAEQAMVAGNTTLADRGTRARDASEAPVVIPAERLSSVVPMALRSGFPAIAVMIGDRLLGVVTREQIVRAVRTRADDPYVAELMDREVLQVDVSDDVAEVRRRMGAQRTPVAAVFNGERYLGLVSRDNLRQWFITPPRTAANES
jgi:Zn-dependent protease